MIYAIEVETDHEDVEMILSDAARDIAVMLGSTGRERYSVKVRANKPHSIETFGWWSDDLGAD